MSSGIDPEVVRQAEIEMRRPAPHGEPSAKRKKVEGSRGPAMVELVGRFAYEAPQRLQDGCKALLLTCQRRNERTATKEALTFLQDYLPYLKTAQQQKDEQTALPAAQADVDSGNKHDNSTATAIQPTTGPDAPTSTPFSTAKMSCCGVVCLMVNESYVEAAKGADGASQDPIQLTTAVKHLLADFEGKKRQHATHCVRVIPLEQTCLLEQAPIQARIKTLVSEFLTSQLSADLAKKAAQGETVKYAVAFKNREDQPGASTWDGQMEGHIARSHSSAPGGDSSEASKEPSDASGGQAKEGTSAADNTNSGKGLGKTRDSVIPFLAKCVVEALPDWKLSVDLKKPELVLNCEVIPASGKYYAGLALLLGEMCTCSPKIVLKSCTKQGGKH